jgi:hypothetical protein
VTERRESETPSLTERAKEEGFHEGGEICDPSIYLAAHQGGLTRKLYALLAECARRANGNLSTFHNSHHIGPVPGKPAEAGAGEYNYGRWHTRLHEIFDDMKQADPETVSWSTAWLFLRREIESITDDFVRGETGKSWEFEEGKIIRWRPDGISLVIAKGKTQVRLPVIAGFFKPVRSVLVEGWTYFEVFLGPADRVVASAEDLHKRLRREGRIRKKKLGEDVLVEVLQEMAPLRGAAFPTMGLYVKTDSRELDLVLEPVPVQEHQQVAAELVGKAVHYEATGEDLSVYARLLGHFHAYEALPAMGLSGIAPASYTLRQNDVFVPHLWHWSLCPGLGKSAVSIDFSRGVWGREIETGNTLNSEFRIPAVLDATCTPVAVEEAERLDVLRFGATIKASCERHIVARRGTTMLTMIPFGSRGILFLNGNRLGPKAAPLLARFLAPRFDSGQAAERKAQKPAFDALRAQLKPVGGVLARQLRELYPTLEDLLSAVRRYELEITAAAAGAFQDIRRPQMWAVAYVGLTVWAAAFAARDVDWTIPSVAAFTREVVLPVDAMTFEGKESIVGAFRSWFAIWRNRNLVRVQNTYAGGPERFEHLEEVRGDGELWEEATLNLPDRTVVGTWITKPLTDEYNRQAAPDLQISSIRELAVAAADEARIPHDQVLDGRGMARSVRLANPKAGKPRVAFLPREAED